MHTKAWALKNIRLLLLLKRNYYRTLSEVMRRIFYNEALNESFLKDGYVVVPFFEERDIQKAIEIFDEYSLKSDNAFYLSIWNNDVPSRQAVHSLMMPMIQEKANSLIADYKFLISCFAVKINQAASAWGLHQDDSFTDESQYESLSIWIALSDIDEKNGAMRVLEGSQKVYVGPRAPTIQKLFSPDDAALQGQMKALPMKAGEAVIFNHRVLHDSGENTSGSPRLASVSVMIPAEAPVLFYYNKGGDVDTIQLVDDYYLKFKLGERPEGSITDTKPLSVLLEQHKAGQGV